METEKFGIETEEICSILIYGLAESKLVFKVAFVASYLSFRSISVALNGKLILFLRLGFFACYFISENEKETERFTDASSQSVCLLNKR